MTKLVGEWGLMRELRLLRNVFLLTVPVLHEFSTELFNRLAKVWGQAGRAGGLMHAGGRGELPASLYLLPCPDARSCPFSGSIATLHNMAQRSSSRMSAKGARGMRRAPGIYGQQHLEASSRLRLAASPHLQRPPCVTMPPFVPRARSCT